MRYFGSHFVFAYILNCSTLTKFQFSVWSSTMPEETESIKKKRNTSKQGKAPNLGLAAGLIQEDKNYNENSWKKMIYSFLTNFGLVESFKMMNWPGPIWPSPIMTLFDGSFLRIYKEIGT